MPKLTLSNANRDSLIKQVVIDVATGMCVADDREPVAIGLIASTLDFIHPLLSQPILYPSNGSYVYEYDDLDGLLDAAKFVYATLIQVENPQACEFHIRASSRFVRLKEHYKIPFSINHKKQAKEWISLEQFNAMISRFNGITFHYQDTLELEQILTISHLPAEVNADLLYQTDPEILEVCKQADDLDKYEIRYINRFIGFGVYARQDIAEDEWITHYCGLKNTTTDVGGSYAFGQKQDTLKLRIEALNFGNLSRFINHAPKRAHLSLNNVPCGVLDLNAVAELHGLHGNDVIVYRADRAIAKGEQILINYGEKYFPTETDMLYMKKNGHVVCTQNNKVKESRQQRHVSLQFMAQQGAKEAQWRLMEKPLIILALSLLCSWLIIRH